MRKPILKWMVAGLTVLTAGSAFAQWTSQTIALRPGWNAVFLEVQPEPQECDVLFAGLQVESVWRYNRQTATVQFIDDPNKLVPNQPEWLTYLPPGHPLAAESGLSIIEGGRPYLIKRADTALTTNWTVWGTPVNRTIDWLADSLNFVGFPLANNSTRTISSYLSHAEALATNPVYRLSASGVWVRVNNPAGTPMPAGESFWVRSSGPCDYSGTVAVELERSVGLQFGKVVKEESVRIRNASKSPATIRVSTRGSGTPPLSYWLTDLTKNYIGWTNLETTLARTVPAGGQWELRLAVRRGDMTEKVYQDILEISDGNTRVLVPVSAEGFSGASGGGRKGTAAAQADRVGLWIGSTMLTNVNQPANRQQPHTPTPTASDFQFRLIVHVDTNGQARLLQRVIQRWEDGTYKPASNGSTNQEMDRTGRLVLFTDEAKAADPRYKGAALRDGQEVGRRYSSAAFSFRSPIPMQPMNAFGTPGNDLRATVIVPYNDPLNPFVHRYHPDHNNLDDRGDALPLLPDTREATRESYTITREVSLEFSDTDPMSGLTGWGDTRVGGTYTETITGLHQEKLIVEGMFQLFKVSTASALDPE